MIKALLLATATITLFPITTVKAEDASSPDKSEYTLFNPVPSNLMRSFSTDRPAKTSSPYTVDAGHFQYESDIANWIYDHNNTSQTTISNLLIADPALKVGLTQNADLELALTPININNSNNRTTGVKTSTFGFGDVYARVKFNLFGNDGGNYALAVVPYVKAPTASHNIGNNHWEGGGYMPFVVALPNNWSMNITSEMDILENAALNGTHTNFQNTINFSHPLFADNVTGSVEFWSDVNNDVGVATQYTGDFALAWLVKDNLQLDCGVNVGLNKAANDVQPYIGISQRF